LDNFTPVSTYLGRKPGDHTKGGLALAEASAVDQFRRAEIDALRDTPYLLIAPGALWSAFRLLLKRRTKNAQRHRQLS
jgi:hypothetical protein